MVASAEDEQSHASNFLRLLSARLPAGVTGTTLVMWTVVLVLAVRLSVYMANFIAWQVKIRRVVKQFHHVEREHHPDGLLSMDHNDRYRVFWVTPFLPITYGIHPSTARSILSSKSEYPLTSHTQKPSYGYAYFRPWLGDGLLLSDGPKWQRNRRLLTPAFHFDILKHYVQLFYESTAVLLDKWMSRGPDASVELLDDIGLMTLDNILKCSLGYNSRCQADGKSVPYILAVNDLTRLFAERGDQPLHYFDFIYYLSSDGRRFRKACKVVHSFAEQVIKARKEELKKGGGTLPKPRGGKCMDLLDVLLQAKIQDEVNTFLFAGHHTTASGISWTLHHLPIHKDYQDKCRRELEELLRGRAEVTWHDIGKLPFITMCIKESMRCVPPVRRLARTLKQDLMFSDGKSLPKGSTTFVDFGDLHRNRDVWPNPKVYDPYRFSPENSENRHPHAFLPFSAGPRNCIGQNFAMNEMKVAVALILQRFQLELDHTKPPAVPCTRVTNQAEDGIWVKVHPLKTKT
ncbi:leukotriene-B4 omega-hydroxylase 3-like [Branchiostoma floridae]|uniref:Leukotriene-B4 omega-hydroxylase 3-like n=1 Tax=Branchiostoma floridae TaxID=7739 RepID=A0A9J7MLN2_BRAFL|nr:leukotriene-B4 omega-hydroxylase 3-like [Branchiostoma floridae]